MPHYATERLKTRGEQIAFRLRQMIHDATGFNPVPAFLTQRAEDLEIAARLLEQASASKLKKAIHSLREDQGKYLRRPKGTTK